MYGTIFKNLIRLKKIERFNQPSLSLNVHLLARFPVTTKLTSLIQVI